MPRPTLIKENNSHLVTFTKTLVPLDRVVKLVVKYGSVSILYFKFFVVLKGSRVMGTNLFNGLGFNVLDLMNNEVPIN